MAQAQTAHPGFSVSYHQFDERPLSDSCWSLQTGPDGRIYIACCIEHTGGQAVTVVRYDSLNDKLEYLFDMDEVTGDLRDSGRATQCKIHYSFVPDPGKDILYCATHLSGPPINETSYNPWAAWHDPVRAFRGAYLVAYDTKNDKVLDSRLFLPKEGCRCLCIDTDRQLLFALSYPRDHFFVYDLKTGELSDKGRLGSVNSQAIFHDGKGRAYTFNDRGQLVRYTVDSDKLEELPIYYPCVPSQTPWHAVLYDVAKDPAEEAYYMVPWKGKPRLARFWPHEGKDGRIDDLGPLTQSSSPHRPHNVNLDHVGGLVFGNDGYLYYVKSKWAPLVPGSHPKTTAWLCRINPITLKQEELSPMLGGAGPSLYVSRGAKDADGHFCFGKIMAKPAGAYRVENRGIDLVRPNIDYLRAWG